MTIPASQLVSIIPSVLGAGGTQLVLNGLILTTNARVPVGQVLSFPNDGGVSVAAYFGAAANEVNIANAYFAGFNNSSKKPSSILFAQYNQVAVAAYMRGGSLATLGLAGLQALSGSLTVSVDGYPHVISSISFAGVASFSAAAAAIQAAFTNPTESSFTASIGATFTATGVGTNLTASAVTGLISPGDVIAGTGVPVGTTIVSQTSGTTGGAGVYVTSAATTSSAASLTANSTVMNVTVAASPTIAVGQTVAGAGLSGNPQITAQITGTVGGVGTYRISSGFQIASEAMTGVATVPVVTYDSISGGFDITSGVTGAASLMAYATGTLSTSLALTQATGAILSQGAAAAVPAAFMTGITQITQNWATFMTAFDPDNGSGNTVKQAFAAWTNTTQNRYMYVAWDTDITPTASNNATTSLGNILKTLQSNGTCCIYEPSDLNLAAFVCGSVASIDFAATNGRTTMAFRGQAGLAASVTSATVAANLIANGYNFYGAYATANQQFVEFQPGSVSGGFAWVDSYVDQIWFSNALQLALMSLLQNALSIPYNQAGYDLVQAACMDPINAAINFGAIRAGVTLSAAQAAQVNAAAGTKVSDIIQYQGWYLQIVDAQPIVRAARQSPPINLWYTDGQSIQQIVLNSILIQ